MNKEIIKEKVEKSSFFTKLSIINIIILFFPFYNEGTKHSITSFGLFKTLGENEGGVFIVALFVVCAVILVPIISLFVSLSSNESKNIGKLFIMLYAVKLFSMFIWDTSLVKFGYVLSIIFTIVSIIFGIIKFIERKDIDNDI